MSPKQGVPLTLQQGSELKLVYPQKGAMPEDFTDFAFDYFFLQPMDGPDRDSNTRAAIDHCLRNPQWRLSLQTHKFAGIP
jgi:organic radical activating enzyme